MLNFKRFKFDSSQKVEVLVGKKLVMIINIEYYDKSNIQCINNLKILNIRNELLPVHYTLELKNHNDLKKLIMVSQPQNMNIKLEDLSITSNDLNNIYNTIQKNMHKDSNIFEITVLVKADNNEILYTFDKVYKKEFQWFNKANYKEDLILVILRLHLLYFYPILLYNLNILFYI